MLLSRLSRQHLSPRFSFSRFVRGPSARPFESLMVRVTGRRLREVRLCALFATVSSTVLRAQQRFFAQMQFSIRRPGASNAFQSVDAKRGEGAGEIGRIVAQLPPRPAVISTILPGLSAVPARVEGMEGSLTRWNRRNRLIKRIFRAFRAQISPPSPSGSTFKTVAEPIAATNVSPWPSPPTNRVETRF